MRTAAKKQICYEQQTEELQTLIRKLQVEELAQAALSNEEPNELITAGACNGTAVDGAVNARVRVRQMALRKTVHDLDRWEQFVRVWTSVRPSNSRRQDGGSLCKREQHGPIRRHALVPFDEQWSLLSGYLRAVHASHNTMMTKRLLNSPFYAYMK
jgi:hypothetical protein